jgi:hypothetical protein
MASISFLKKEVARLKQIVGHNEFMIGMDAEDLNPEDHPVNYTRDAQHEDEKRTRKGEKNTPQKRRVTIREAEKKINQIQRRIVKMLGKKVNAKGTKLIQSQRSRSVGGGRAAAAIDSGRGGVAKSLMTRKLTPKT